MTRDELFAECVAAARREIARMDAIEAASTRLWLTITHIGNETIVEVDLTDEGLAELAAMMRVDAPFAPRRG